MWYFLFYFWAFFFKLLDNATQTRFYGQPPPLIVGLATWGWLFMTEHGCEFPSRRFPHSFYRTSTHEIVLDFPQKLSGEAPYLYACVMLCPCAACVLWRWKKGLATWKCRSRELGGYKYSYIYIYIIVLVMFIVIVILWLLYYCYYYYITIIIVMMILWVSNSDRAFVRTCGG